MSNERNAGRKPIISSEQIKEIEHRYSNGESLSRLAEEYGVSRQALHKRIKAENEEPIRADWIVDGQCVTSLDIGIHKQNIRIFNYVKQISKLPFSFNNNPTWDDFIKVLEEKYFAQEGADEMGVLLMTDGEKVFSPSKIQELHINGRNGIPEFAFTKKDILITRTDTDGFQMKALSDGREYFVKSQAFMSGIKMDDWAVEIIAANIAEQLDIPCVRQKHCFFAYAGRKYDAVYSENFELDGYTFISFESLLESNHLSTKEDYFLKLGTIEKLKWCAKQLSELGNIDYGFTEKYMIDLAVLDCLVGNVDRHTRNFGLFFNTLTGEYEIPLIFDNGMGLFEHDYYRDNYKSFDEAMNNVYVTPYGEDPFDMLLLLHKEFDLKKIYAGIDRIEYLDILSKPFALEYERRMNELWQKLD